MLHNKQRKRKPITKYSAHRILYAISLSLCYKFIILNSSFSGNFPSKLFLIFFSKSSLGLELIAFKSVFYGIYIHRISINSLVTQIFFNASSISDNDYTSCKRCFQARYSWRFIKTGKPMNFFCRADIF